MTHPLVYEINTRCWLRDLAVQLDRPVTLESVPDTEIERWKNLGFTHVWLMGVWPTGPRSRAAARADSTLPRTLADTLPDWRDDDFTGSPFAIADYTVARELGGEPGLEKLRAKLHARGLSLLLDFVPNHLGLDHRWIVERPELFVQSPNQARLSISFPQLLPLPDLILSMLWRWIIPISSRSTRSFT